MSHLDEGTLHALLDGEIPSHELAPIQAHLASCEACRNRLEEERRLAFEALELVELVEVPGEASPRVAAAAAQPGQRRPTGVRAVPGRRRSWTFGLAWAASLVGAVGLGYAARGTTNSPLLTRETEARSVAPNPQPADSSARPDPEPGAANPAEVSRDQAAGKPVVQNETRPAGDFRKAASAPLPAPSAERRDVETPKRQAEATPKEAAGAGAAAVPPGPPRTNVSTDVLQVRGRLEAPPLAQLRAADAPGEVVTFPDALQRLNGTIRLIPGMIPVQLQAIGPVVRVVYPGGLVLSQELVDGRLIFQLTAPPGFPPDSLERLRARVRE